MGVTARWASKPMGLQRVEGARRPCGLLQRASVCVPVVPQHLFSPFCPSTSVFASYLCNLSTQHTALQHVLTYHNICPFCVLKSPNSALNGRPAFQKKILTPRQSLDHDKFLNAQKMWHSEHSALTWVGATFWLFFFANSISFCKGILSPLITPTTLAIPTVVLVDHPWLWWRWRKFKLAKKLPSIMPCVSALSTLLAIAIGSANVARPIAVACSLVLIGSAPTFGNVTETTSLPTSSRRSTTSNLCPTLRLR